MNYYFKQFPGFRVSSGVKLKLGGDKGRTTDWVTVTDNGQGIGFYTDGISRIRTNKTSMDICGKSCKEDEPAKIIFAQNGAIILEAEMGDIVLKARNIRLEATADNGEVTIVSPKHVHIKAAVARINGTRVNILGDQSLECISSGAASVSGETGTKVVNGIDEIKGGNFLSKLLAAYESAKKFFNDVFE